MRTRRALKLAVIGSVLAGQAFADETFLAADGDISLLSIEELGNIEVSSVSRHAQPLRSTAAAVYVITAEDIRRSGANSIPEMLRLAPNLQVVRINSGKYAITARGFATDSPNKLLVLIDGRSVYSSLHAAVFWDGYDILPENIDHIEVISGPGGTLWGANAVNGVINIITKSAADTTGTLISVGGGTEDRQLAAQAGANLGETASFRTYVKAFDRLRTRTATNISLRDGWDSIQGGFRFDWQLGDDGVTAEGDINRTAYDSIAAKVDGENFGVGWRRSLNEGATLELRAYYDRALRVIPGSIGDERRTYNAEIQHSFAADSHSVVWGAGYRVADGTFTNIPAVFVLPPHLVQKWANGFVQDTIALTDEVTFVAGLKYEYSSYTGGSFLPSGRIAWAPSSDVLIWGAVSRAVRTPVRVDRDYHQNIGAIPLLVAGDFQAEKLTAYEAGIKGLLGADFSYAISTYYNDYTDLRTTELTPALGLPAVFGNMMEGHTYGVEAWGTYAATSWWRISGGVSAMEKNLHLKPGSRDLVNGVRAAGNDPSHQVFLRSSLSLGDVDLDVGVRTIARLPDPAVPAYTAVDSHIEWRVIEGLSIGLTGENLLDRRHAEYGALPNRASLGRTVYASLRWRN